jgi:hypothetical protein
MSEALSLISSTVKGEGKKEAPKQNVPGLFPVFSVVSALSDLERTFLDKHKGRT